MNAEPHGATLLVVLVAGLVALAGCASASSADPLRVASGTIVVDTGLGERLADAFTEDGGPPLAVQAVGSGEAFALGRLGEVDALWVHEPTGVEELLASGVAVDAVPFARIRYVVAGPPDDPAGVGGSGTFAEAFRRIARSGVPFVSRGDRSGTHQRELAAWDAAGVRADDYAETGQGQAETLRIADERGAYLLTDVSTLLLLGDAVGLDALASDPDPWTAYQAVALEGPRLPGARRLLRFLSSGDARTIVDGFGGGVRPVGSS